MNDFEWHSRSRVDPLFATLIVAGKRTSFKKAEPFLGVVTMRGVAYQPAYVATGASWWLRRLSWRAGLGAMLIQQTMENVYRVANEGDNVTNKAAMTREQAVQLMRQCVELAQYHDCCAYPEVL